MRLLNRTGGCPRAIAPRRARLALSSVSAHAQAWVPPARIGLVSVVYQTINNTNHRLTDGSLFDGYDSLSRGVLFNLDYAFTDRFSISVGVPYLGSKYTGPEPSLFGLADRRLLLLESRLAGLRLHRTLQPHE